LPFSAIPAQYMLLEVKPRSLEGVIDFHYAYNASCAYSPRWACPLAPPENFLKVPVRAGELVYKAGAAVTDADREALRTI